MDSATEKKAKLSVRRQTNFKKPRSNSCVNIAAAKKTTSLCLRERTLLNKAYELSTLCGNEVCVIHYGEDGELKTYPKDESKVKDMAERFINLRDVERRKKSYNLSQFLKKKMEKEKEESLKNKDNKFSCKVLEMDHSLETRLRIYQDNLCLLSNKDRTEPDESLPVASSMTEQNNNSASGFFSTDPLMTLPTSVIDDQIRDVHYSGGSTTDSSNGHQNKFSLLLYNHDEDTLTQLPSSASSFDLGFTQYDNLGTQGFGDCRNSHIPTWNQTSFYGGDPVMFPSYN